ncbi:MAG: tetratricopeptide repeat protein [Bacillota bacterium]
MSRSIHTTWASFIKEHKKQKAKKVKEDPQKLDKMYDDLTKKRQIKRQIIQQRTLDSLYVSTAPDSIPIHIYDESEFVHYPITEKDIRDILIRLPQGIVDGLKCIELKFGYGKEKEYDELPDPDPYTGRPGFEILPGVFQPKVLGIYTSKEKIIEIYSYVYKNIPDFKMWNVCLKIYMFMTLAHELSHHFDFQSRMGRGRWLDRNRDKIEAYAESIEHKWLCDVILPYIEETYKEEINELNEWVLRNVGIRLPLSILAGDPRKTLKNGLVKIAFAENEYFFDFVKEIYEGKPTAEARINLARGFHYADLYDRALDIIETILELDPKNIEALTLKADTFVHQEKYTEAEKIAKKVLSISMDEFDAWYILSEIYFEQSEWKKLLKVSEHALRLSTKFWHRDRIVLYQVKAIIEIGELNAAEEKLNTISNTKRKIIIKKINELRKEIIKKKQVKNL